MCGIVGFVGPGDREILAAMMQSIAHRGPDASGTHVDDRLHAYLGHLRLSILDHQGGAQPMWNETGEVGIVFNGEIYNHIELRKQLEQRGHIFKTDHSDTEVLVHGYEEWGNDLPGRLNGMFAFAILDTRRNRIFAARDRFGEKPFYYSHKRRVLWLCQRTARDVASSLRRSIAGFKGASEVLCLRLFSGATLADARCA